MRMLIVAAACASCLAAVPVLAADSGFYFGVVGGQADYEFDRPAPLIVGSPSPLLPPAAAIAPILSVPRFSSPVFLPAGWLPIEDGDDATAWGVTAGYRIMRYVAVELTYLDLGKLEQSVPIFAVPPFQPSEIRQELRTTGPALSAIGTLPIGAGFSLYARAGVLFAQMQAKTSTAGFSDDTAFSSQNALWGAGAQYDWGDHWSVRFDFQRFENLGENFEPVRMDVDLITFGVLYRL